MTDRELLELAAKAAGVPLKDLSDRYDCWEETPSLIHTAWNPLTDDGDALRLAVKLGIDLIQHDTFSEGLLECVAYGCTCEIEAYKGDPYAATRRAIVRAAAEIGKAMP